MNTRHFLRVLARSRSLRFSLDVVPVHPGALRRARSAAGETSCLIKHAGDVVRNLGLTKVDLIKIDCEGAEYDVLSSLPSDFLFQCKWIVGEMHDESAFPLLALLAPHFDLDLKKRMFAPFFRFRDALQR